MYLNAGTIVAVIVAVAGCVRYLSHIEKGLGESMDAHIENVERKIDLKERESLGRAETLRHETGEMGLALRQKIHDVEIETRDTFVRKDMFEQAMTRIEKSIEKAVDKIEEKIDKLTRYRDN